MALNGVSGENGMVENNIVVNADNTIVDPLKFHDSLRISIFSNVKDVEKYYHENINMLTEQYGILLFLYSVIATRVS